MDRRNIPGGGRISRARRVGRREARNRDPMHFRPPLPALPADYSHIKLQSAPADTRSSGEGTGSEYSFIRRQSLQEDLKQQDEEALYDLSLIPNSKKARSSPQSFAEAAAMNRSRGRGRSRRGTNETLPDLNGPVALGSLGTFKVAFKNNKKGSKKWTPIDLATLDSGTFDSSISGLSSAIVSEADSETERSPSANSAVGRPIVDSNVRQASIYEQHTHRLAPSPQAKNESCSGQSRDRQPTGHTPQQPFTADTPAGSLCSLSEHLLPLTPTNLRFLEFSHSPGATPLHQREDSRSTADKIVNIMSRIGGVFDEKEWGEEMPGAEEYESPEQLAVKPQAKSYTTVGSLVNSNATPQFNAPVRIQREGAGRRPPPVASNGRALDNYYSARTPPPHIGFPSNRSYSTPMGPQYGLYLSQQPSLRSPRTLSEFEKDAYLRSLGVSSPHKRNEEQGAQSGTLGASTHPVQMNLSTEPAHHQQYQPQAESVLRDPNLERMDRDDTADNQPIGTLSKQLPTQQPHIFGLDKMQTVQRLASYPNPMQQIAKERLAEFAAAKIEDTEINTSWVSSPSLQYDAKRMQQQQDTTFQIDTNKSLQLREKGLDSESRISASQLPNSLATTDDESLNYRARKPELETSLPRNHRGPPPAYPQPLTAGPPGQRQNAFAATKPTSTVLETAFHDQPQNAALAASVAWPERFALGSAGATSTSGVPHGILQPASRNFRYERQGDVPIRDTLTSEQVAQYYPYGLPDDFDYHESPTEIDSQGSYFTDPKTSKSTEKKKSDEWWYAGLRNLERSGEDYSSTFEGTQFRHNHGRCRPVAQRFLPVDAARLLDNLLGTIIGYADRTPGPNNRAMRSKFIPAPSWAVDNSTNGNRSVFDEDWGQPPKRLARDLRYQHEQRGRSGKY